MLLNKIKETRGHIFLNDKHGSKLNEFKMSSRDFPGGAVVKNPPVNAGDTGAISGLGRSHMPRSN